MHGMLRTSTDIGVGSSLYESYKATSEQTDFSLAGSYRVGTHELLVYVNGVRQTLGKDYREVNNRTVRFIEKLEAEDYVLFTVQEVRNSSLYQEFIAEEGQTEFRLTVPYHPGFNTLQVYDNGMLLRINDDYIESDETTIILTYGATEGSKITFREIK